MLARAVRSGLTESYHDGAISVLGRDDSVLFELGDVERPFFLRSAIKPFQATVSLETGLRLTEEQTALACSSHGGQSFHRSVAASILESAGLDESALRCPPDWPLSQSARLELVAAGETEPRGIYHNCSGKHSTVLAACVAAGWPVDSYTRPDHPYQVRVQELLAEVTGEPVEPVGVDGCGFPTLRGSVRGLAKAFTRLAFDERFAAARLAMMAHPAMTSDIDRPEAALMGALPAAVKGGAVACTGVAVVGQLGLGAKCWDGSNPALYVGVIHALVGLGVLEAPLADGLEPHAQPVVLGGGRPAGRLEPAF
ncbi:MAG: asparaginase [Acidimicrobiia bacterium]|nr:asparaginase [Acidimicrobiia bacterium]